MKADLFQSCGHCWVFQICWHIEFSTFTALFFRIWNSSTGIPSPPLALFVVMLCKAHLTSHSRMSGFRCVITPLWLSILVISKTIIIPSQYKCKILSAIVKVKVKSLSHVQLFATPWSVPYQAPPSMGFSRQEHWSGLPFPSPGDLPDPGIEPWSPAFQADTLTSEPPGKCCNRCSANWELNIEWK